MNPVDEFLMEKDAGFLSSLWGGLKAGGQGLGDRMGRGFMEALPGAAAGAAVATAGSLAAKGYGMAKKRLQKTRDYDNMVRANPALRKMDASKVQMTYNSLRSTAPDIAGDPLLAGSFIRKTIETSPESGPYIDPLTAKTLSETQRNIAGSRRSESPFSIQSGMMRGADLWMSGAPYGTSIKDSAAHQSFTGKK